MNLVTNWFRRTFSDPQIVILGLLLLAVLLLFMLFGQALAPAFASLIIAYLLDALVVRLEQFRLPRILSVIIVFTAFLASLVFIMLILGPMLSRQLTQLVTQLPNYLNQGQELLARLPELYPQLITESQSAELLNRLTDEMTLLGQRLLTQTFSLVPGLLSLLIFLILVPILVFFFLKDKSELLSWFASYMPRDRALATTVWREVDAQIGNYIRGKALEILIVALVSYVVFSWFNLQYSVLLATLTGLSVLIPYIGAAAVTLPVALVALVQFGWGWDFFQVVIAYGIIQALDGNVLVPLLFSEVVDLHPVAIILAVLIFGSLWGFWGVFFAIPLATVVNAILRAWPRQVEVPVVTDSPTP